jgi:hypothetical protein
MDQYLFFGDASIGGVKPGANGRASMWMANGGDVVKMPSTFDPAVVYDVPNNVFVTQIAFPGWQLSDGLSKKMREAVIAELNSDNGILTEGCQKVIIAAGFSDLR